jgi:hypothetical protein
MPKGFDDSNEGTLTPFNATSLSEEDVPGVDAAVVAGLNDVVGS